MVLLLESGASGTLNATGPALPLDFAAMLETCRAAAGREARVVWVDEDFLTERGVAPWTGLPLWLPVSEHAHSQLDCSRAMAAGLRFRPLLDTARDTLRWELGHPPASRPPRPSLGGAPPLAADRESALLEEWNTRVR
jgi:2'-hydroxyisoflavone reductase